MKGQFVSTLVNPQNGNLAFKIFDFEGNNYFDHIQRNNYYSLLFIQQGAGIVKADFASYKLAENTVFAFSLLTSLICLWPMKLYQE